VAVFRKVRVQQHIAVRPAAPGQRQLFVDEVSAKRGVIA
jgi:hypothetical protein